MAVSAAGDPALDDTDSDFTWPARFSLVVDEPFLVSRFVVLRPSGWAGKDGRFL